MVAAKGEHRLARDWLIKQVSMDTGNWNMEVWKRKEWHGEDDVWGIE